MLMVLIVAFTVVISVIFTVAAAIVIVCCGPVNCVLIVKAVEENEVIDDLLDYNCSISNQDFEENAQLLVTKYSTLILKKLMIQKIMSKIQLKQELTVLKIHLQLELTVLGMDLPI